MCGCDFLQVRKNLYNFVISFVGIHHTYLLLGKILYNYIYIICQYFGKKSSLTEHVLMGPILTAAEGFILGVGAKMFTIMGPVIVYGVSASVVYGFIYWIWILA